MQARKSNEKSADRCLTDRRGTEAGLNDFEMGRRTWRPGNQRHEVWNVRLVTLVEQSLLELRWVAS